MVCRSIVLAVSLVIMTVVIESGSAAPDGVEYSTRVLRDSKILFECSMTKIGCA